MYKEVRKIIILLLSVMIIFCFSGCESSGNVSEVKTTNRISERAATTNNETAYQEYAKLLTDLISKHGSLRTNKEYYYSYFLGVNYAELLDFNNDGIDELYVVYAKAGQYYPEYNYEVWGFKDGVISKLDSGTPYGTDVGEYIAIAERGDQRYILTGGEDAFRFSYYHGFDGGNYTIVKSAEVEYETETYKVDGKFCTQTEFEQSENEWRKNVIWHSLCAEYYEDSEEIFTDIIDTTNNTKRQLGINQNEINNDKITYEQGEISIGGTIEPYHFKHPNGMTEYDVYILKLSEQKVFHIDSTMSNGWVTPESDYIQLWYDKDIESLLKLLKNRKAIIKGCLTGDAGTTYYLQEFVLDVEEIEII